MLSPTFSVRRGGAFEVKFLLDDAVADEVLRLARESMAPDPHGDSGRHDGYVVNSLYFDTPQFDTFHRQPGFRRRKFRLRRYGHESTVYVERKTKARGIVRKRRTPLVEAELPQLAEPLSDPDWPSHWFHRRIVQRGLVPTCHVAYERIARVDTTPEGQIRLTIDRFVRCRPADGLAFPCLADGRALLPGQSILEFKFREVMPAFFKRLVHDFALAPQSVSKFRRSLVACGLVAESGVEAALPSDRERVRETG